MIRLAPLSLVALLGLACTRVDSGDDELVADASESASDTTTSSTDASSSSSESVGESGMSSSSSESDASGSETAASETAASETAASETAASESETAASETETGASGVMVDLGVLALLDVNPNSATFEQTRHPSDYAGQLSGYYFAHAT